MHRRRPQSTSANTCPAVISFIKITAVLPDTVNRPSFHNPNKSFATFRILSQQKSLNVPNVKEFASIKIDVVRWVYVFCFSLSRIRSFERGFVITPTTVLAHFAKCAMVRETSSSVSPPDFDPNSNKRKLCVGCIAICIADASAFFCRISFSNSRYFLIS